MDPRLPELLRNPKRFEGEAYAKFMVENKLIDDLTIPQIEKMDDEELYAWLEELGFKWDGEYWEEPTI